VSHAPPASALERRKAVRLLVSVGCAHALLFLLSYALLTSAPGPRAPYEELLAFYESDKRRRLVLVGLYVMPFAGITFLWFSVALRTWLRAGSRRENEFVAGLHLASSLLYVALFFGAAAAFSVMSLGLELAHAPLDPLVVRLFPQYGATLLIVFAMRMAAMFVFTTSGLARVAGLLPTWFVRVGWAAGLVLLLSTSLSRVLVLVLPLWLLALCALIHLRTRGDGGAPVVEP